MIGSFYKSIGNNTVSLNGIIAWSESAAVDYSLYLLVWNNGVIKSNEILETYTAAFSTTARKYVIAKTIQLQHNDDVALILKSDTVSSTIQVIFSTETYLQIADKKQDDGIKSSECYGITAFDAMNVLLNKMSVGEIELDSELFEKGIGLNDLLTSGNNIRGILSPINLSFDWVFEQFSKMYDLEADLIGGKFIIRKAESTNEQNSIDLGEIKSELIESVDLDKLYSSIKVGYKTWQSESKLKGAEYNSLRTYETDLKFGNRELDLTLDIISSSYIIEEQRRLQFDAEKSRDGGKYDENVFIIAIDGDGVEGIEKYAPTENILLTGGVYNLKYSPASIINNNNRRLINVAELKFVSGEGNYVSLINGKLENRNFNFGQKMPKIIEFEMEIEPEMFEGLSRISVLYKDERKNVKVLSAIMGFTNSGKGIVTIIGEIE